MLLGQHYTKLEGKNRLAFPAKFKATTGDLLVITYGFEKSLMVLSAKEWGKAVESISQTSFLLPEARELETFLFGGATEVKLDKQGRFVLPDYLRDFADVKTEAVFVGVNTYARLWSKEVWENYKALSRITINESAKKIGERMVRETKGETK